jgi:hypothetical protein
MLCDHPTQTGFGAGGEHLLMFTRTSSSRVASVRMLPGTAFRRTSADCRSERFRDSPTTAEDHGCPPELLRRLLSCDAEFGMPEPAKRDECPAGFDDAERPCAADDAVGRDHACIGADVVGSSNGLEGSPTCTEGLTFKST